MTPRARLALSDRTAVGICLLVPLITWIWICRDWPSRLGFYSDDWRILLHPTPGTWQAFVDSFNLVATRPASAPFTWFDQWITDWSQYRTQILNCLGFALSAHSVGYLSWQLCGETNEGVAARIMAAVAAATAFLVLPSNIATFAWGSGMLTAVPAVPAFCYGAGLILNNPPRSKFLLGLLLLLISHLSYEAFYFQEIAILTLWHLLNKKPIDAKAIKTGATLAAITVLCIAYNRIGIGGVQKSFNPKWLFTLLNGYPRAINIFLDAAREHSTWLRPIIAVAVACGVTTLSIHCGVRRAVAIFAVVVCGVLAAGALYSLAGYGFAAEGPSGRVSIVFTFYFALMTGLLCYATVRIQSNHKIVATVFFLAAVPEIVGFGLSSRHRVNEWASAWDFQRARLATLPPYQFDTNDPTIYLLLQTYPDTPVQPATAPWEISGAVAWEIYNRSHFKDRSLASHDWSGKPLRWFAAPKDWFFEWNGARFDQGPCHSRASIFSSSGKGLVIWHPPNAAFQVITEPLRRDCD